MRQSMKQNETKHYEYEIEFVILFFSGIVSRRRFAMSFLV